MGMKIQTSPEPRSKQSMKPSSFMATQDSDQAEGLKADNGLRDEVEDPTLSASIAWAQRSAAFQTSPTLSCRKMGVCIKTNRARRESGTNLCQESSASLLLILGRAGKLTGRCPLSYADRSVHRI